MSIEPVKNDDFDLEAFVDSLNPRTRGVLESRTENDVTRMVEVEAKLEDAKPKTLAEVLVGIKPNPNQTARACLFCKQATIADGCEDGWQYTNDGVRMCQEQRKYINAGRLTSAMTLIGLDESRFAKGWHELEIEHKSWRTAKALAKNLKSILERGVNMFFFGMRGRGKTHAALLLCREALKINASAAHVIWSEYTKQVRDTFSEGAETTEHALFQHVKNVDLLLIDELKEKLTDSSQRMLSEILEARHNACKATLITSNLTLDEAAVEMTERGYDRFVAGNQCIHVVFNGKKYRDQEDPDVSDLLEQIARDSRIEGQAQA